MRYDDIPALKNPKISRIIQGTAKHVDPTNMRATVIVTTNTTSTTTKTQEEHHLDYDYLVVGTGLRRAWPVAPRSTTREQYLAEAAAYVRDTVGGDDDAASVVVVGGGAVGVEVAAELKTVRPAARVTLVHSRDRLLSSEGLPDSCKDRAAELVRDAGVELLLNTRVAGTREVRPEEDEGVRDGKGRAAAQTEVSFVGGGSAVRASAVVMAVSRPVPSTDFLPRSALDDEGLIKVRASMQFPAGVPNADCHFAAGDAVRWSGIKRCGGAMHMGYFVAHNIHEMILERMHGGAAAAAAGFLELGEIPPMIGLAVGRKAMSFSPGQGVCSGEDVMKAFFGDDLGFSICWNHMRLGESLGLPKGGLIEG